MADWDMKQTKIDKREKQAANLEKKRDQDLNDLVEYTKWMSTECAAMRSRVRKAEKVISDLRSSGEDSVESLMETLYTLKINCEEREADALDMQNLIQSKEAEIMAKENMKAGIKQQIEIDNADRENEIQALRAQMAEQKDLMAGQTKLMNELQVLCEFTQNDIIKANRDLTKKKTQKK